MLPLHLPCLLSPSPVPSSSSSTSSSTESFSSLSIAVPRDSLRSSPSGTLIMRPANGPARRLAVSVGGVCVLGVDAGSCVEEVEERGRKRRREGASCEEEVGRARRKR